MVNETTLKRIQDRFGAGTLPVSNFRDDVRLTYPADKIVEVLTYLKDEAGFDVLTDVTAVDYLEYRGTRDRFAVIYLLASTGTNERLVVKVYANDPDPVLPSSVPLWQGATWLEREVFDMFGIRFEGHPDLRRILLPDEFSAYPLRKDYPLRGRGERHNFPVLTRTES